MRNCAARTWRARTTGLLAGLLLAGSADAQVRLPGLPLPAVPPVGGLTRPLAETLDDASADAASAARALRIRELLRRESRTLAQDPSGNPIVRGELVLLAATGTEPAAALAAGFSILRREPLPGLGLEIVVLVPPAGRSLRHGLGALRGTDRAGSYDYNHLYLGAGRRDAAVDAAASGAADDPASRPSAQVGMIDSGVDVHHAALAARAVDTWGCGGVASADPHGTAVASLLVGRDGEFHGVVPGARLYAADVFCGRPDGGNVVALARALDWLVGARVGVICVSLVGPRNALLEAVVARLVARGHLLVAAVGNDGPAAPALYPAAYPGVIAVTGVDARHRVLLEASRGAHVAFAAPGAELLAARPGGGYVTVRGTSFAAPIVAGLLASRCAEPDPACAAAAVAALVREAVDLGAPGRDPVYGYGLVGSTAVARPGQK
ncbi:MAG: S8 family serine peptidase [Proteobacteria bacterium]|nr:S8 family serine peptidase [Pseudomonadota bacterium]